MFFDLNEILYTSPSNGDLARELGVVGDESSVWEVRVGYREFRIAATILGTADERCDRGTATYSIEHVWTREQDLRDGSWSGWRSVPEHLPGCSADSRW